jgi:hypothetical protein
MKYKEYSDLYQTSYYKYVYSVNLYAEFLGKKQILLHEMQKAVSRRARHSVESDMFLTLFDFPHTLCMLSKIAEILNEKRAIMFDDISIDSNKRDVYSFLEILLRFYGFPLEQNRVSKMKWLQKDNGGRYNDFIENGSDNDVVLYTDVTGNAFYISYTVKDDTGKMEEWVSRELSKEVSFYFGKLLNEESRFKRESVFQDSTGGWHTNKLTNIREFIGEENFQYLGLHDGHKYHSASCILWVCANMYTRTYLCDTKELSSLLYQVGNSMATLQ